MPTYIKFEALIIELIKQKYDAKLQSFYYIPKISIFDKEVKYYIETDSETIKKNLIRNNLNFSI